MGGHESFQQIYDTIAGKMYSLCLRFAGNTEDANNCFKEGFVMLYHNLHRLRGEASIEDWCRRAFIEICVGFINKRNLFVPPIAEEQDIPSNDLSVLDRLSNEDLINSIRRLPDIYRTVVNLYLVEGYDHKEIGEMLNMSEETSRAQLSGACILLRQISAKTP